MDEFKESFDGIYGWKTKGDKCVPPSNEFPECVLERLRWIYPWIDEAGLSFFGALQSILAYDEKYAKEQFEIGGGKFFPLIDEFKKWRDETPLCGQLIAIALTYGYKDPMQEVIKDIE